jgi:micrococcal nuclease
MNTRQVYLHRIIFSVAALLSLAPAWAADELRTVVKVYSGNGIKLQAQTSKGKDLKVRYIGVDAPDKGKPFFEMCRNANRSLVENRKVRVQSDAAATESGGRPLVNVYAGESFINAELIRNGYGLVAAHDGNFQNRDLFLALQQEARKNLRGLWAFEDQSDEPYYVGSKSGKVFHRPSCPHVKGLAFDDRLIFRTKAEALTGGYSQDWRCCPLFKKSEQASAGIEDEAPPSSVPLKK